MTQGSDMVSIWYVDAKSAVSLLWSFTEFRHSSHLWNEISFQYCIFIGHSWHTKGHNIAHSLDLMDNGIGVRHAGSVIHDGSLRPSNYFVYFFLNLFWMC